MEHQHWIKRSLISAAVATSISLTACSGGGGSTGAIDPVDPASATTTLSGIVADGYLLNATVCLDLNLSKTCDSGEPMATSTSGGNYSLEATQAQINAYPVIAEIIAGTTVDEDNPGVPVAKAYTLTAPAGKGAFVSPLSTIVQAQIETTGKTAEQIENEILASIGQDPTVVSLFDDYVASKTDTTNSAAVQESYLQLHQIAQVTASTIANNIELIEAAVTSGEIKMDLSTTLDSLITIIAQNVIAELTTISTEIENATTFDANTIASAAVPPVDTTTIEDQVAVAEAASNAEVVSNVESIFTTGISWLWAEFDWKNEIERSHITYDSTTGKLSEPIESYFAQTTSGWFPAPVINDNLVLQADGTWKAVTDSWDGSPATFDGTTATAAIDSPWGNEAISNVETSDLNGLNIKQFVANKLPDLADFIDPSSTFISGSNAYSFHITSLEDSYSIGIWRNCGQIIQNVNGNCNTVVDYSGANPLLLSSLTEVPTPIAFDPSDSNSYAHFQGDLGSADPQISPYQSMYFELVKGVTNASGTTNYYLMTFSDPVVYTKVGTGTWSITTVNGTELLMVDHPDALMSQYSYVTSTLDSPEENNFFAIQDSVVRKGNHWPANIVENTAESILTNQQAQNEITGAFLYAPMINTTPSAELACDTDSGWNPISDVMLVTFSFLDFESVVTACGGALTVDVGTLTGQSVGAVGLGYNMNDGTSFTLMNDNTGYYAIDSSQTPDQGAPFSWTIDPTTNYITIESSDGSFRFILAVIAMDQTTLSMTFKGYIEKDMFSDLITNQGSDGQIVNLLR